MKYRIFIEQDEDGIFVAECPSFWKTFKMLLRDI
jgi:predicted RNase H-like HicB family nuclease